MTATPHGLAEEHLAAGSPGAAGMPGGAPAPLGRDFGWLWTAQTVSSAGTAVTTVALPALAVLQLGAGPAEVGLLTAASRIPYPVLGLAAGVLADRLPRRAVMVVCDLARVLVLGAVPVAGATGRTSVALLLVVALLSGVFGVFFDICNLAYVPALVGRSGLVRAYAWLEVSSASSSLAGPGLGGLLVQLAGAARAVAADSVSYLVSALCLLSIRRPAPAAPRAHEPALDELRAGVRFVLGHPLLRSLLLSQGVLGLGAHAIEAPLILFAYDDLRLTPGTFGLLLTVGGAGAMLGAVLSRGSARRPAGSSLAVLSLVDAASILAVPLARLGAAPLVLAALFTVEAAAGTVGNVIQVTLRQSLTPEELQGRMNALFRVVYWGAWPLAGVAGGGLAAVAGPVTAILAGGGVCVLAAVLAWVTPLRHAGPAGG